jgi:ribosome-binding factor A
VAEGGRRRRSADPGGGHGYPRAARINEVLRQVVASELARLSDIDDRLRLITVTGVHIEADLRRATVWLSSLPAPAAEALAEDRVRLQSAIARQVRLKRTPQLTFTADPAVSTGLRVEEILRDLGPVGTTGILDTDAHPAVITEQRMGESAGDL